MQRDRSEGCAKMNIGKAVAIFSNIDSSDYTIEEKGTAIMKVAQMPTHNGITKTAMLKVIWWLLNMCFDLPVETAPPKFEGRLIR